MEWIIGAVIVLGAAFGVHRMIERTPTCTCNQPGCGGGCIGRKK